MTIVFDRYGIMGFRAGASQLKPKDDYLFIHGA